MKSTLTFIFLCSILICRAQMRGTGQIIMLHPSVGNTITLNEKQKFGLFPQKPDSTFEMAQVVRYDDSTYTILFRTIRDGRSENTISKAELLQMYLKIENIQPAPVVTADATGKKTATDTESKSGIPLFDLLGCVIHTSAQILVFIADFNTNTHHYNNSEKYDATKSYLTYPQDHYIPQEGDGN